ncbi:MAG: gluconate 2-dehydrogenase subunit 3 family protein [Tannerellaceae bacterium]|jgi:gluconate 2-dehydrogenase gamma chain|nr:gluconate 2-dehydrogenase subunit 3 family protein [Tannerellaceae bacterium]
MIINRREFIKQGILFYGSLLLLPACRKRPDANAYRVLSAEEAACLIALCEQVIPADDMPGATEAGVVFYIDTVLSSYIPEQLERYREGIRSLQAYCRLTQGGVFETLPQEKQIEIMQQMEAGNFPDGTWEHISPQAFLSMVIRHTMQGFYGPPCHGGNKNYASYRMLHLDYPMLAGQNRYENG